MQLQCHASAKKHKKAKNEHKTPQEFPAKEPDKQIIHNGGDRNVTPLFYGGMAYDIDYSWQRKNKLESYMGK